MVYRHDVIVNPGSIAWVQQDHEAATHREVTEDVPEPLRVVVGIYFYWKFMHLYGELRVFYPRVAAELLLLNTHMDADGTLNV
ncbi:hypothetical protein Tco_1116822, partial [Tanacetum coccineum]